MNTLEILNRPFDFETHKKNFVDYLEIMIDPQGTIHYAIPSHIQYLMTEYMNQYNYSSENEAWKSIPEEYSFDAIGYLTDKTGYVAVWNNFYVGKPNKYQKQAILKLIQYDLFKMN